MNKNETTKPPQSGGSALNELLGAMREAAIELAQYASYAEIVGGIGHNRAPIREWCDKVFDLNAKLRDMEDQQTDA